MLLLVQSVPPSASHMSHGRIWKFPFSPVPFPLFCPGGSPVFRSHVKAAYRRFVQVTASLVCPPVHTWASLQPSAPAVYHRWACNCSVAWSCSERLEESRLANEATRCVASPLLREYVPMRVCVCVREPAGVIRHIHLVCCYTTQLLANRRKKKTKQGE